MVGHTSMAWLVPVVEVDYTWDAGKKQFPLRPLPDFVARVQKVAKLLDDTLMVMCRSGGRGAMAVNLLAKAGFRNVYNITDGMEGDTVKDPESVFRGQRLVNGWKNSGLPWTYRSGPAAASREAMTDREPGARIRRRRVHGAPRWRACPVRGISRTNSRTTKDSLLSDCSPSGTTETR